MALRSYQQYQRWETSATMPAPKNLRPLASALELPDAELGEWLVGASQQEARAARHDRDVVIAKVSAFVDKYEALGHTYQSMAKQVAILVERALPLQDLFIEMNERLARIEEQLPPTD
jgi:hypothetical protein